LRRSKDWKEGMAFRRGKLSLDEMLLLFKQNSRRYAKRQLTWFRRDERIRWFPMEEGPEGVVKMICALFRPAR
jgi:tRNA dimethylallyltransferase